MPGKAGGRWVRLNSTFPRHPKVQQLTYRERFLLIASWLWVSDHGTDGVIPSKSLPGIGRGFTPKLAEKFVEVGLWDEIEDGWRVHDYLDWNPPSEQIKKQQEGSRQRTERWRQKKAGDAAGDASRVAHDTTRHEVSTSPTSTSTRVAATPEPERGAQAPPPPSGEANGHTDAASIIDGLMRGFHGDAGGAS